MCSARALLVTCLFLAIASTVRADAILTLTALTPENAVGGYLPGTVVDFQVDVSQDKPSITQIRLAQLDFAASDAALTFLGPDVAQPDGISEFVFDFSTLMFDAFYAKFPNYSIPAVTYSGVNPTPGFMLEIPAAGTGSLTLGTGQVALPITPGTYLLDALNAGASDPLNQSAWINFGFGSGPSDPITNWRASEGSITGQPLSLRVVPEPGTLMLLVLGAMACVAGRKYRN